MNVRRVASVGSALLVAGIAALASYSHMRHLALSHGQDRLIATLLPISVDGMMVVSTVALGDGRRFRGSAWLAFWIGVAASVVANVLAAEPSLIARCISAWPAVAFLLVIEILTRGVRSRAPVVQPTATEPTKIDISDLVPVDVPDQPGPATEPVTARPAPRPKPRSTGRPTTATKVARAAAKMPDAAVATIAAKAGVSPRTARRHLAAKTPDKTPATPDADPVDNHEFAPA